MRNRKASVIGGLIGALGLVVAGCDTGKTAMDYARSAELRDEIGVQESVVRIKEDIMRNRLWVLTLADVRVYNTAPTGKRLIRVIPLPNWSVVGLPHVCKPELVLDRSGAALVTSNSQARVLRIDADRFALEDYAIRFQGREGMDSGFGALAFAADGALVARTGAAGTLWKIDLARASATPTDVIKRLPADPCVITQPMTTQSLSDFERS